MLRGFPRNQTNFPLTMLRELALKLFTYFKNELNILFKNLLFLMAWTTYKFC